MRPGAAAINTSNRAADITLSALKACISHIQQCMGFRHLAPVTARQHRCTTQAAISTWTSRYRAEKLDTHLCCAGLQHQINGARRLQAERVGHRRPESHQAILVRPAAQDATAGFIGVAACSDQRRATVLAASWKLAAAHTWHAGDE